jgi:hypothetical protein
LDIFSKEFLFDTIRMLLFHKEFIIMRRIYLSILITGILLFLSVPVKAQISFSVGVNISSQPIWGPVGYDDVEYYYLPDIDAYYYVPRHLFYYQVDDRWISSSNLPARYHDVDLYNSYKVVINDDKPYMHDQDYKDKYSSYRNRHDQQPIRDSHDIKYFAIKNHPEHNNWVKQQRSSRPGNRQGSVIRKAPDNSRIQGSKPSQSNKPLQANRLSEGNKPLQANRLSEGNKPLQANRLSEGNKPLQANRPSDGNKPTQANMPSQGNKSTEANRPSQSNKQDEGKEHEGNK